MRLIFGAGNVTEIMHGNQRRGSAWAYIVMVIGKRKVDQVIPGGIYILWGWFEYSPLPDTLCHTLRIHPLQKGYQHWW